MRKILSDKIGAVSIWLEVLLYGIYCTLFAQALYIVSKRKSSTQSAKVFLHASIVMWILSTIHLGLNLYRLLRAYVWLWMTVGPADYFLDRSRWDNFTHELVSMLTIWLANFLLIYRCFLVWNGSFYVIAFPAILLSLNIAATAIALHLYTEVPHRVLSEPPLVHWVNTTYALALLQIILTTGLIAYRTWTQDVPSKVIRIPSMRGQRSKLIPIVLVAAESAAFYAVMTFVAVILYASKTDAKFLLREAVIPTAGIALIPLIIRSTIISGSSSTRTQVNGSLLNWHVPPAPNHNDLELETTTVGSAKRCGPSIQLRSIGRISDVGVSEVKFASDLPA